jgi:diguanylate cyclase (GGDEF)-like protein
MRFFSTPARRDGILLTASGLFLWFVCTRLELMRGVLVFAQDHSAVNLDAILLAALLCGGLASLYAWRRNRDLREEVRLRHRAEEHTTWIADHDILTRLPNRRYLQRLYEEVSRGPGRSFVVYAIDLDGFKRVNDLVGHDGGNELLAEISRRLQTLFPGEMVVRMGGDEFAVFTDERLNTDYRALGEKLIAALNEPLALSGIQVQVGASVGMAVYPEDSESLPEVTHFADVAMYEAKRHGRNALRRFDRSMSAALAQRSQAESALRGAISRNEIVPHYQPLIDLETGRIRGFEALARWRTTDGSMVPPTVFIELAEDAGLITLLSERLLRQACSDALSWPSNTVLAFNISPTQLTDHLLGLRIVQILAETGLPPNRLEIEITESALVRDVEAAAEIIESLHDAGISIALDDFGTGYSSLAQLSKLKFDKVKIDRSFVESFQGDEKQEKIVRAIIGLGHGLGIVTTAEGIEQSDQFDRLKAMGCDFGQGYLFGKAMPPEEVRAFFAETAAQNKAESGAA